MVAGWTSGSIFLYVDIALLDEHPSLLLLYTCDESNGLVLEGLNPLVHQVCMMSTQCLLCSCQLFRKGSCELLPDCFELMSR